MTTMRFAEGLQLIVWNDGKPNLNYWERQKQSMGDLQSRHMREIKETTIMRNEHQHMPDSDLMEDSDGY